MNLNCLNFSWNPRSRADWQVANGMKPRFSAEKPNPIFLDFSPKPRYFRKVINSLNFNRFSNFMSRKYQASCLKSILLKTLIKFIELSELMTFLESFTQNRRSITDPTILRLRMSFPSQERSSKVIQQRDPSASRLSLESI